MSCIKAISLRKSIVGPVLQILFVNSADQFQSQAGSYGNILVVELFIRNCIHISFADAQVVLVVCGSCLVIFILQNSIHCV